MRRFIMLGQGDCEMHQIRPADESWIEDEADVYVLKREVDAAMKVLVEEAQREISELEQDLQDLQDRSGIYL